MQTSGHGAPELIFLPDLAMPAAVWDHVVARFEVAYRCHVILPAGFGDKPPAWTARFLDATADAVIAHVREEGLVRPVLVGHGLGGVLALQIALKAPDLPGRLVLVDSLPCPAEGEARRRPVDAAADPARYVREGMASAEQAAGIATEASRSNPAVVWQAAAELLATDLRPELGRIRCPTLVLGTLGGPGAVSPRVYRRQYRKLPGVRFAFFGKARHFLMMDDLDGFTEALRRELAGRR